MVLPPSVPQPCYETVKLWLQENLLAVGVFGLCTALVQVGWLGPRVAPAGTPGSLWLVLEPVSPCPADPGPDLRHDHVLPGAEGRHLLCVGPPTPVLQAV